MQYTYFVIGDADRHAVRRWRHERSVRVFREALAPPSLQWQFCRWVNSMAGQQRTRVNNDEESIAMKGQAILVVCAALAAWLPGAGQAQQEAASAQQKQIVAASIREKGFGCKDVSSMQRSKEGVAAGRTVWIARCETGTYKVIYLGDTGFTVSRVE